MTATDTAPFVLELSPVPDVVRALHAVRDLPGVTLFESASHPGRLGRYSYLVADPVATCELPRVGFGEDPFVEPRRWTREFAATTVPGLPPFQGGVAGVLAYEVGHAWEQWPRATWDEFTLPDVSVGLYDCVVAWDHERGRAWIVSHGIPESDETARIERARHRATELVERLQPAAPRSTYWTPTPTLAVDELAPTVPLEDVDGVLTDFRRDEYLDVVRRAVEYVHAGDVFQVNVSQRLLLPWDASPYALHERLRTANPAPFGGVCVGDDWAVVSASPERFVSVRNEDGVREVETRPIKGTRRRDTLPEAALFGRDVLRQSEKDRAENVMIVDLLRNDLSRVCEPGSIRVPELCAVETYATVQHLVSEIRGRLRDDLDVWDLFAATLPGGSITGAPKPRAMEIVSELEPTARGPYCGTLFWAGLDGAADANILIRTFVQRRGWLQCSVGGGIVADSDPRAEYEETLVKAAGMLKAVR